MLMQMQTDRQSLSRTMSEGINLSWVIWIVQLLDPYLDKAWYIICCEEKNTVLPMFGINWIVDFIPKLPLITEEYIRVAGSDGYPPGSVSDLQEKPDPDLTLKNPLSSSTYN